MKLKLKSFGPWRIRLFLPGGLIIFLGLMLGLGMAGGILKQAVEYGLAQRQQQQNKALMAAAELLHKIWQGDLSTIDYARQTLCVGDRWPSYDPDILQCLFARHPYLSVARGQ
ncbi:MAG: hypothetical protein J6Y94_02060, partial [Bacteriovoracaceae bacterium]|nr:hypothetical protein [Bacteriovoracaceae bacterium]